MALELNNTNKLKELIQQHQNLDYTFSNKELWKFYDGYDDVSRLPINILESQTIGTNVSMIQIHYREHVPGYYYDTGKSIEFVVENHKSYVEYQNKKFILKQFHFHNASEHSIDGKYSPIECHFVHEHTNVENKSTEILVIALLLKFGPENVDFIENAFDPKLFNRPITLDLSYLNRLTENPHYHFIGTLTTPPFTGGLIWFLFNADDVRNIRLTVTEQNYSNFFTLYINNRGVQGDYNANRYAQPLRRNYLAVKRIDTRK